MNEHEKQDKVYGLPFRTMCSGKHVRGGERDIIGHSWTTAGSACRSK
jgi:hypothetical protein